MSLYHAWAALSWSSAAAVTDIGALLILLGCAIGAASHHKGRMATRKRRAQYRSVDGKHWFRTVTDRHYRAGKL